MIKHNKYHQDAENKLAMIFIQDHRHMQGEWSWIRKVGKEEDKNKWSSERRCESTWN